MTELPYWKFMVGDWFKGDIQCCSHETKGVFVDLCSQLWRKNGELPDDDAVLSALCRCDSERFSRARAELEQWHILDCSKAKTVSVSFISEQLALLQGLHAVRVEAGRKGGNAKQLKRRSKALAKTKQSSSISDTESDTESETPPLPPKGGASAKSFKQWTSEDFKDSIREANRPELLTKDECIDFHGYWTQKSASGVFGFALNKTWDTRRRMQTALKRIYQDQRDKSGNHANRTASESSKAKQRSEEIAMLADLIKGGESRPGQIEKLTREVRKSHGQDAVADAERLAGNNNAECTAA